MKKVFLAFLSFFLAFPRLVHACAVCFGGADANLVKGFTWGVVILLILPFALAGGLAGLIVYSAKKHKTHV